MSSLERHLTKLLTLCFTFLLGPILVVGGHTKIQTIFHKNLCFGNKKRYWRKCGTFLWRNCSKILKNLAPRHWILQSCFFLQLRFWISVWPFWLLLHRKKSKYCLRHHRRLLSATFQRTWHFCHCNNINHE